MGDRSTAAVDLDSMDAVAVLRAQVQLEVAHLPMIFQLPCEKTRISSWDWPEDFRVSGGGEERQAYHRYVCRVVAPKDTLGSGA